MSFATLLAAGFVVGVVISLIVRMRWAGCLASLIVPVGAALFVSWSHSVSTDLRSTSGLDYLFVPVPPIMGWLLGCALVWLFRDFQAGRDL